jgi:hypothetical protein
MKKGYKSVAHVNLYEMPTAVASVQQMPAEKLVSGLWPARVSQLQTRIATESAFSIFLSHLST